MTLSAHTRLFALLGDPVSHSLSPRIHNAGFQAHGLDAVYLALRCLSADCAGLLQSIARAGGAGNVTAPHKMLAASAVESRTEAVNHTHACNTFWLEDGRVCGDNTDVRGFQEAARLQFGPLAGMRVTLIGAGGAARAVVAALAHEGVDQIDVIARTPARVHELQTAGATRRMRLTPVDQIAAVDLVINATPLGLRAGDPHPVDLEHLAPETAIFDLVYAPGGTPWVRAAQAAGFRAFDGTEMLLQQAAAAFERWWQTDAPIEEMRSGLG